MKTRITMKTRIRWFNATLAGLVCLVVVIAGWMRLQSFAYQHLRSAVVHQLSRAWNRDVRIASISRKVNGTFVLRDVNVAGDVNDPPLLRTPEATAWVDLWELIAHRKVVVRALALRDPELFLRTTTATVTSFDHVDALDQLAATGIHNVSITGGQLTYGYSPTNAPGMVVHITGLNGDAVVTPKRYDLRLKAGEAHTGAVYLSDLSAEGTREGNTVTIARAKAVYEGNPITTSGTYKLDTGATRMKIIGSLPLARLAAPNDGKFRGTADVDLTYQGTAGAWEEAAGSVTVKGAQYVPVNGTPIIIESGRGNVRATPAHVDVNNLWVKFDSTVIEGGVTVSAPPTAIGFGTPYAFKGTVIASNWQRHLHSNTPIPVRGGRMAVRLNINSTFPKLPDTLSGEINLTDARFAPPGHGEPVFLDRARSVFAWRKEGLKLSSMEVSGDGLKFSGGLTVDTPPLAMRNDAPYDLHGLLKLDDSSKIRKWFPAIPASVQDGRLTITVSMKDRLPHTARNLRGSFVLSHARVATGPKAQPVRLDVASGQFSSDGSRLAVRDVAVKMDGVALKGSLVLNASLSSIGNGTPYRFEGRLDAPNVDRLRQLVPGLPAGLQSGKVGLRVVMQDHLPHIARTMQGQFLIADARVGLPGGKRQSVEMARGDFVAAPASLILKDLSVKTDSFAVNGDLKLKDPPLEIGNGTPYAFQGAISAWDWKALSKLFPDVPPYIQSGKLILKVALQDKLPNVPTSLQGRFALNDALVKMSSTSAQLLSVKQAHGAFVRDRDELSIADASAQVGNINARGSLNVDGIGTKRNAEFQLAAVLNGSNIAATAAQIGQSGLAQNLVGGAFTVQAKAKGDIVSGVENLHGLLTVRNARLASPPLRVETLSSEFQQRGDNLELNDLKIVTPQFSGNGKATVARNKEFDLQAKLIVSRLASLGGLHPALASFSRGSGVIQVKGEGKVDNVGQSAWAGSFTGEDGSWKLAQALWGMSKLDFEKMRGDFSLRGGKAEVTNVNLDGKDVMVTGNGVMESNGSLHGTGIARVARQLIARVIGSTASEVFVNQLQKLPFEFLTVRFKLAGTASAPAIKWQMDEKLAQQLVEKAVVAGVQRKVEKTIEKKIVQIAKLDPNIVPPLVPTSKENPENPAVTPPISSSKDLERTVLRRTLGRLLRDAIK